MVNKIAFKMKLMPNCREEYKRRHDEIWPEMVALLKESGVSDYTIFLDEESDTLFAVQRQAADGASSQDIGSHPVVQRWWRYMADIMETHSDSSPVSKPLKLVFHLD
ncbi:L-rhamnose mutarotase [Parapedobacter defluvii]|uniref:L-rhamnose mutarotase n=2 Tax=Parapedobacter defluvii TaxID=2045106 RepID=A0ABQ1L1I3_9SPHI|nr:L-rhamnose mutarotase [Parapedobacter defluvii]RQP07460.1 MAG: L-rhamnose mutarotase [Parapedobacter sp.]GGC17414.1 L-rhamnose mutarotase [Parapedobacter defluvii]